MLSAIKTIDKIMINSFKIPSSSLERNFAVYVIVGKPIMKTNYDDKILLYVGKTGDNRKGCNPIISRIGNHFSFNKIHSQSRNYIPKLNNYEFEIFYAHFDLYQQDDDNKEKVDKINEMERELNKQIQTTIGNNKRFELLNALKDKHFKTKDERNKRLSFQSNENLVILHTLVENVFYKYS